MRAKIMRCRLLVALALSERDFVESLDELQRMCEQARQQHERAHSKRDDDHRAGNGLTRTDREHLPRKCVVLEH